MFNLIKSSWDISELALQDPLLVFIIRERKLGEERGYRNTNH